MRNHVLKPLALLLSAGVLLSGCALTNGSHQNVVITTNVEQASVTVDGHSQGETNGANEPMIVSMKRSKKHTVIVEKDGFTPKYAMIDKEICTLGYLDIAGAVLFLIPVVSFIQGGAFELSPEEVYLPLQKIPQPTKFQQ